MQKITINPFGSVRELFNDPISLEFPLEQSLKAQDIKDKLISIYANDVIINSCAFSTDEDLILDDTIIENNTNISILPPVCGG